MSLLTEQHRVNFRFFLLFVAGLVILVPIAIYHASKAKVQATEQPISDVTGGMPVLTDSSFGPVKIGMTFPQLAAAIGPLGDTARLRKECDFISAVDAQRLPRGVSMIAVNGRVVRIDIENDSISTGRGVRVGDSEEKVKEAYGPTSVIVEPHKYISGHYLEVKTGEGDGARGLVFETDGTKVITFRAGLWEPVRWVEGCA